MRYIFADHDRPSQLKRIREGIEEYRSAGAADPTHFRMHPVYDELLCQLADHFLGHWKDGLALAGLGGYGRTEMSPYSDVDLLFLKPEETPEGVYRGIRSILYLLWDAKVELGHSVRTVAECRQEAEKDLAVLTSLMDARFVWGNERLYRDLLIERERMIHERDPLDIYLTIEQEIIKSGETFGHTIYLLEPNVKEGPGSLRSMQLTEWLGRIIFGAGTLDDLARIGVCGPKSVEEVQEGRAFMGEVRTRLHFLAGRRDDLLTFEAQFKVAEQMGYKDSADHRCVENLMRDFYRHAAVMDFFGRRIRARVRLFLRPPAVSHRKHMKLDAKYVLGAGGIHRYDLEEMEPEPREMLRAFQLIADLGCDLDIRLADAIRRLLRSMHTRWMEEREVNELFLDLFKSGRYISKALNTMMKTGFLERFIPEFGRVRFLRQHDAYHQYTVDLHTMMVLENLDRCTGESQSVTPNLLSTIRSKLERPWVLYLAALFHDIGKGSGAGHEQRGEDIARPVLQRLGLSVEEVDDACFLIRNHLAMTGLALKKDLHDESMIARFAETVMHKRRLDMLMLLTHADLKGVSATAYNSWKAHLIEELYYRTLDVIEGESPDGEELGDWVDQIKAVVKQMLPPEDHGPALDEYLNLAVSRYFLDFYPEVIADHFKRLQAYLNEHDKSALEPGDLIVDKRDYRGPGYSAVTIMTRDETGLFYKIAGALSAGRINILSAWSHTVGNDTAVGTFHVTDIPDGVMDDPQRWDRFTHDMQGIISGKIDVDELVESRRGSVKIFGGSAAPGLPLRVDVDNAASDRATIVEVNAQDRPGLLYDITRKLSRMGLNIVLTKITTQMQRAVDIFYVVDKETKQKIVDFDRLEEIRASLRDHLSELEEQLVGDQRMIL